MKFFAPFASIATIALFTACSGFTEIGEGGGGAGMAAGSGGDGGSAVGGSSGKGGSGSSGKPATGGSNSGATGGTGATGGSTPTGGTNATGGTGGGYDPCAGKACGATCMLCAPDDVDCAEDAVIKYCDAGGHCNQAFPVCSGGECETRSDCPVLDIPCDTCADGTSACPTVDCVSGTCVSAFPTCQAECSNEADCPISLAPCQLCEDGTSACPWARCEGGKCTTGIDTCEDTDPCAGKSCGDYCTTSSCTGFVPCLAVAMFCDDNLKCQLNHPVCETDQCKVDGDCNTDICGQCPNSDDGGCAAQICVDGQCTFKCPEDPCGGCDASELCIYQVGGPGPSQGYRCAKSPACDAVTECACVQGEGECQAQKVDGYCYCDNGLE
jgi:hypothetical protein